MLLYLNALDKNGLQLEDRPECPISRNDHNEVTVQTMPTGKLIKIVGSYTCKQVNYAMLLLSINSTTSHNIN